MKRITTATKAVNLFGVGKDGFTSGNPNSQLAPTQMSAAWCNGVQEEIATGIELSGQTLNPADFKQLAKSIPYLAGHPTPGLADDIIFEWKSEIEPVLPTFYNLLTDSARVVGSGAAVLCVFTPPNQSLGLVDVTVIVTKDGNTALSRAVSIMPWAKHGGQAAYDGGATVVRAGNAALAAFELVGTAGKLAIEVYMHPDVTGNSNIFVKCEYTGVRTFVG